MLLLHIYIHWFTIVQYANLVSVVFVWLWFLKGDFICVDIEKLFNIVYLTHIFNIRYIFIFFLFYIKYNFMLALVGSLSGETPHTITS